MLVQRMKITRIVGSSFLNYEYDDTAHGDVGIDDVAEDTVGYVLKDEGS